MGSSKSSSKRGVYSNTILPQETRNISNKQCNLTPKAIRERRKKKKKKTKLAEGLKSIKLEMKKGELQQTPQKYKASKRLLQATLCQ